MCLLPSRRHIEKREDPGDEVEEESERNISIFVKAKVSLVKKHHLIYDWLTFVLTGDMQIW